MKLQVEIPIGFTSEKYLSQKVVEVESKLKKVKRNDLMPIPSCNN